MVRTKLGGQGDIPFCPPSTQVDFPIIISRTGVANETAGFVATPPLHVAEPVQGNHPRTTDGEAQGLPQACLQGQRKMGTAIAAADDQRAAAALDPRRRPLAPSPTSWASFPTIIVGITTDHAHGDCIFKDANRAMRWRSLRRPLYLPRSAARAKRQHRRASRKLTNSRPAQANCPVIAAVS